MFVSNVTLFKQPSLLSEYSDSGIGLMYSISQMRQNWFDCYHYSECLLDWLPALLLNSNQILANFSYTLRSIFGVSIMAPSPFGEPPPSHYVSVKPLEILPPVPSDSGDHTLEGTHGHDP